MKFTLAAVATFFTLTSATLLCDNLLTVRSDLGSLAKIINGNITTRAQLTSAAQSLTHATGVLNGLNTKLGAAQDLIDRGSAGLKTLDIDTGCNLGWLKDLQTGLLIATNLLNKIYAQAAVDFQNGNIKNVNLSSAKLIAAAKEALIKVTEAQKTLNTYNRNVLCWDDNPVL